MFRPKKMFRSMKFLWPFLHALFYEKLALKLRLVTKRVTRKMELNVYGDILLIFDWWISISCLSLDSFAFTYLHLIPPSCFACIGFGHSPVRVGAFCSNGENGWPLPRPRRGWSKKADATIMSRYPSLWIKVMKYSDELNWAVLHIMMVTT